MRPRRAAVTPSVAGACVLYLIGALPCLSARAGAQEWRVDALAGRYRYENSPVGATNGTGILGIRYLRSASWISAVGGVPLTSTDTPWGTSPPPCV